MSMSIDQPGDDDFVVAFEVPRLRPDKRLWDRTFPNSVDASIHEVNVAIANYLALRVDRDDGCACEQQIAGLLHCPCLSSTLRLQSGLLE